jgi:Tol biopolymer transport system component/imidazolonepropionase-like amidohydrolase
MTPTKFLAPTKIILFLLQFLVIGTFAQSTLQSPTWNVENTRRDASPVKIQVKEGTWMNLDMSPDGSRIVFDLLGDIYSIPASGGIGTPLTSDLAWQMQPSFSPDGKHIVYTSDEGGGENIWIMDLDGGNKRAVSSETFRMVNSPAWSPDGKSIAVRKHFTGTRSLGAGEIWAYPSAGGDGIKLTSRPNEQKDMGEPAFSPDGRYVYYSQDVTPGAIFEYSKDSEKGIYAIKRLDLQSGEIEVVLSGRGGAIRPTLSHDGSKLAYISRVDFQSTLFVYDLQTGKKTAVYHKLDRDKQAAWAIDGVYPTMSWTPDDTGILFWANGQINRIQVESKIATTIPFEVSREKIQNKTLRFTKNIDEENFEVKMLHHVEVSPDGKKAVYEALGYLYLKDLPNGTPRRLTQQTSYFEYAPSFSRDGKKIVYSTWNDQEQGRVQVINLSTSEIKNLLNVPGKYTEPAFSPDGKTVVYRKFKEENLLNPEYNLATGIYQVSSEGGIPKLITSKGRLPHFADRNDRIYLHLDGEMPSLARVDLEGKEFKTLYTIKYATEFKMAPTGKELAFVEHYRVKSLPFIESDKPIVITHADSLPQVKTRSILAGTNISFSQLTNEIHWNLGPNLYSNSTQNQEKIKETPISFLQPIAKSTGVLALVGGRVVTMEADEVIEDGVVLVEGNHILAVGKKGEVIIPANATRIDLKGKTLIPGIIDTHAHQPNGTNGIIPQQNWSAYGTLAFGVTTMFNPNTFTEEVFGAAEMQKAGNILSPRIFSTGMSLYGAYEPGHTALVNGIDDARFHMDRLKRVGAFAIKMHHHPRREQYQQIIEAAAEYKMMVLSEGGALLQQDLGKIADGASSIEHSVALAKLYEDVYQFWSHSQAASVPTLVVSFGGFSGENYWYEKTEVWKHPKLSKFVPQDILAPRSMVRTMAPEHHYNHFNVVKTGKELHDRGILVAIGGHGQREGLAAHWEMWMMQQGGMTPMEALRAATIVPARHLGLDKNLGSIKVGKLADLAVIDGDVLNDIRDSDKVVYVILNGRIYDAETMNYIGGGSEKKRASFYFESIDYKDNR